MAHAATNDENRTAARLLLFVAVLLLVTVAATLVLSLIHI